jgi:hypothetical protein
MEIIVKAVLNLLTQGCDIISFLEDQEVNLKEFSLYIASNHPEKFVQLSSIIKPLVEKQKTQAQSSAQVKENNKVKKNKFQEPTAKSIFKLDSDDPAVFETFRRMAWIQEYYFDDFNKDIEKLSGKKSFSETVAIIKYLLMFVFRLINDNGTCYVIIKTNRNTKFAIKNWEAFSKDHSEVKHTRYIITTKKQDSTTTVDKKGNTKITTTENSINYWCFEALTSTFYYTYYNFNWVPYAPNEIDPTFSTLTFNCYLGLKAKVLPQYDQQLIQPILEHIFMIFANNDEKVYTYIISWFAHLIQFPRKFLPFLLIMGPKRCGKTTFFIWFVRYLMGLGECGTNVEGLDSIVANFNSHTFRKLFIHVKELKGSLHDGPKTIYDKMEILKSKITDTVGELHQKYMDKINADNYAKFAGCANDDFPIRLTQDDRERWALFWASGCKIGDIEYFNNIKKLMADEDNIPLAQECANHFLTFLLQYKIVINVYQPPISDKYNEVMSISIPQEQQFIKLLQSNEYKINITIEQEKYTDLTTQKEYYLIKKIMFYECYLEYCKKYLVSKSLKEIFYIKIKGLVTEHRSQKNSEDITYYLIPLNWVTSYFTYNSKQNNQVETYLSF